MSSEHINILDKYEDNGFFSVILRYGLYFGAFFQLACISAAVLLPMSEGEGQQTMQRSENIIKNPTTDVQNNARKSHKQRKQDKKKRR